MRYCLSPPPCAITAYARQTAGQPLYGGGAFHRRRTVIHNLAVLATPMAEKAALPGQPGPKVSDDKLSTLVKSTATRPRAEGALTANGVDL